MDVYPLDGQDSLFRLFFMPADTYIKFDPF